MKLFAGRTKKPFVMLTLLLVVLTISCNAATINELPYYNYNYTYWGEVANAPAAYIYKSTIRLNKIDAEIKYPSDLLITSDGQIIISDSHANKIIALNSNHELLWELKEFDNNGKKQGFKQPSSVFYKDGNLYVPDTLNERILKFDEQRNLVKVYSKPYISTMKEDYDYQPVRIAVDRAERIYVVAKNINQGLIVLDRNGEFKGFYGAPRVKPDMIQLIWRIFSTKAMIQKYGKFVPTEYNSIDIDDEDFIYCTTDTINGSDLYNYTFSRRTDDQFAPVKKLNPAGTDVMLRTGMFPPVGDIRVPNSPLPGSPILATLLDRNKEAIIGFSSLVDVKVIDNGIFYVLDRKRSRVFTYDHEGNLLFVFGSFGSRSESFSDPTAIEVYRDDVYVLNSQDATIDVFRPSDYGSTLLEATRLYKSGKYGESEYLWHKVLSMNSNFEQAYIMLGRVQLRKNNYKQAMQLFKNGNDKTNYSKAFRLYRTQIVEDNFILIIFLIIFCFFLIWAVKKLINYLATLPNLCGNAFRRIKFAFYVCFHPFDGFYDLKYEKKGNLATAISILALSVITTILENTSTSYIFNYNNPKYVNILFITLTKLLPLIMFAIANWCLTTLMDGKGRFKDIFIFTCYAQMPIVMINLPMILISHLLVAEEVALYQTMFSISGIWSLGLLAAGTMQTHDYTVKKTVITLALNTMGILVISFLCLFFISIVEKMAQFVNVLLYELTLL